MQFSLHQFLQVSSMIWRYETAMVTECFAFLRAMESPASHTQRHKTSKIIEDHQRPGSSRHPCIESMDEPSSCLKIQVTG
eukprot:s165_g26.t1